jgi:flagellar biosynthesis/type III secretory pathway protein FliH
MNIKVKIETIKGQMTIEFSSATIKNQYNALLDVIRDMELDSRDAIVETKIGVLDDTLDLLGTMMLAAGDGDKEDSE